MATLDLESRFDLARDYTILAALAEGDRSILTPAEAEAHLDRAMQLLKQVVAEGFRIPKITTDPDFDFLRRRPEFQLLSLDLTFPVDPFAAGR